MTNPQLEKSTISQKARDINLDLLRAIAILLVVAFHVIQMSPVQVTELKKLARLGHYGVDLFFVLSGWLIGGLFWSEMKVYGNVEVFRFWLRRALRTVPPYLVALALSWLAVWAQRREAFDLGFLMFVQNYYPSIPYFLVSWSLCIEEHFYLVIPVLFAAFAPRGWLLGVLFFLLLTFCIVSRWVVSSDGVSASFGFERTATHLRMEGLLGGFFFAYLKVWKPEVWSRSRLAMGLAVLAGAACVVGSSMLGDVWFYRTGLLGVAVFFLGVLGCLEDRPLALGVVGDLVRVIAMGSYSLYLTHALAIHLVRLILAKIPTVPGIFYFPVVLTFIALAGWLFFHAIEGPSFRLRDRLAPRRRD